MAAVAIAEGPEESQESVVQPDPSPTDRMSRIESWAVVRHIPAERLEAVRRHLTDVDTWDSRGRRLEERGYNLVIVAVGSLGIGGIAAFLWLAVDWTPGRVGWLALGIVSGLAMMVLLAFPLVDKSDAWFGLYLVGTPLVLCGGLGTLVYEWTVHWRHGSAWEWLITILTGVATAAGLALAIVGGMFVYVVLLGPVLERRLNRQFSEALLVMYLADALLGSLDETGWRSMVIRQRVADDLEGAARAAADVFQVGGNRRRRRDYATAVWLVEQSTHIAANLRQLKRWTLTPQSDTNTKLVNRLGNDLLAAAAGALYDLGRDPVEPVRAPARLKRVVVAALKAARSLAVGLIPLGAVLIAIDRGMVTGAAASYLLIATIALAAVVLVRVLDPSVLGDLSRAGSLWPSLLRPGKNGSN